MKDNKLIINKCLICLLNINNEGKNIHRINRALYYKVTKTVLALQYICKLF